MSTQTISELKTLIEQLQDLYRFMEREGEHVEAAALSVRITTLSDQLLRLSAVDPKI